MPPVSSRHDAIPAVRDPGLQAERTMLAWNRTALAVLVNALVALRSGWAREEATITILAVALLFAGGATFAYGLWRGRQLLNGNRPASVAPHPIIAVAAVALMACAVELAAVL